MQPGGHRFEPGILHQIFDLMIWRSHDGQSPDHSIAECGDSSSLTTEYPANGSFSDHTHAVCMELMQVDVSNHVDQHEFEFLMVKLLRVYGECLGARSR